MPLHELSSSAGAGWQDYTPTLSASVTPPTLGSGSSVLGRWMAIGKLGIVFARFNFGSSGVSAGSGTYRATLPFTVGASQITIQGGLGVFEDNSLSDIYSLVSYGVANQSYAQMYLAQALQTNLVSDTIPVVAAANDIIALTIITEIA